MEGKSSSNVKLIRNAKVVSSKHKNRKDLVKKISGVDSNRKISVSVPNAINKKIIGDSAVDKISPVSKERGQSLIACTSGQPSLNFLHRVGEKILAVKEDLAKTDESLIEKLNLKDKLCPVSSGTNFRPDERLFDSVLESLEFDEEKFLESKKAAITGLKKRPTLISKDPEPSLDMFHTPFEADDIPIEISSDEISSLWREICCDQKVKSMNKKNNDRADWFPPDFDVI